MCDRLKTMQPSIALCYLPYYSDLLPLRILLKIFFAYHDRETHRDLHVSYENG